MTRDIELRAFPIQNNSHTSFHPQETAQDSSSYNSLDQDQQQRDILHETTCKNQVHANKRAVKGYSKHYTITVFKEGDHISIAVPAYDRGPTDPKYIFGKVLTMDKEKPDLYEIVTPHGILNILYHVKDIISLTVFILLE